ncbi:MAG TPA: right-handed parallel beta-helix repeat-containing protein [Opitutaceae bacterium]|nr:right-handed parallel beta-helix repeat-containing protein [Opitutaceae bacterium]
MTKETALLATARSFALLGQAVRGLFVFGSVLVGCSALTASAASYYVDSVAGSDSNAGTSSSAPWQSLSKVNSKTFVAGDRVYFKAGGNWTGQLLLHGSGASGNPIVVGMYGSGAKPKFNANGTKSNTVFFKNQPYWELNDLDVSNTGSGYADRRGISINVDNGSTVNHVYIKNCSVHDVTGEVRWIGGDTADNTTGVYFQSGWIASKRTGGIVFDAQNSGRFNDVLIDGCTVNKCSFAAISVKGVRERASASDSNWNPHTNVTIQNCSINQSGSSLACNGIYLTDTKTGVIQNNVVANAGTCGIELYYCDAVTVQKNETYGTVKKAGGADYNGIDPDKGTTNIVVQYNYSHGNGDGILICNFAGYDSAAVRYNILQNNSRYGLYLHSSSGGNTQIYNNVVYASGSSAKVCYGYGSSLSATYNIRNNIFYSSVSTASPTTSSTISYDYNAYYGMTAVSADAHKITANPLLVSAGSGGTGINTVNGYKLQSGSPCINYGASISSNGGKDYWGDGLYNGSADVGADEFY